MGEVERGKGRERVGKERMKEREGDRGGGSKCASVNSKPHLLKFVKATPDYNIKS